MSWSYTGGMALHEFILNDPGRYFSIVHKFLTSLNESMTNYNGLKIDAYPTLRQNWAEMSGLCTATSFLLEPDNTERNFRLLLILQILPLAQDKQ